MRFEIRDTLEKIALGIGAGGIVAGTILSATTAGTAIGALGGQILDWVPYVNKAIPKGIAYLGNAFSEGDTTEQTLKYLYGNLDKVGACMGFLGGFIRSTITFKKD